VNAARGVPDGSEVRRRIDEILSVFSVLAGRQLDLGGKSSGWRQRGRHVSKRLAGASTAVAVAERVNLGCEHGPERPILTESSGYSTRRVPQVLEEIFEYVFFRLDADDVPHRLAVLCGVR
jgi:hypothetical protein